MLEAKPAEADTANNRARHSGRWFRQGRNIIIFAADGVSREGRKLYEVPTSGPWREPEVLFEAGRTSAPYIRWIQLSLNHLLGVRLETNGTLNPQTRAAIRRFQQRQGGLLVDGIVGPKTEAGLIAAGAGPPPSSPGVVESPPAVATGNIGPTRILDRFESDRASLTPSHQRLIEGIAREVVASWRSSQPIRTIVIAGHTDSSAPEDYNLALGRRRALEVQSALIRAIERLRSGLARRIQFVPRSFGEARPVAGNESPEGKARNRRVEISFAQRVAPRSRPGTRPGRPRPSVPRPGPPARPSLEIAIDQPAVGERFFIDPGVFDPQIGFPLEPTMPTITVRGRVLSNGRLVDDAAITWEFRVSGSYRVRRKGSTCGEVANCLLQGYVLHVGQTVTTSGRETVVHLGNLTDLIVGGNLEVKATTRNAQGRTASRTVQCAIEGRNPSREAVEAMIQTLGRQGPCGDDSWALIRMFCHESAHTLGQFNRSGGVLFGPPAGVGITQRDPEVSEWRFPKDRVRQPNNFFPRIFWNWQENVAEGVRFFRSQKLRLARNDLRAIQNEAQRAGLTLPEPCVGVLMRAAIRRFNGGQEYRLRRRRPRVPEAYIVDPRAPVDRRGYVDQVLGDHGHLNVPLPAIPPAARHVLRNTFSSADLPCEVCAL